MEVIINFLWVSYQVNSAIHPKQLNFKLQFKHEFQYLDYE